MVNASDEPKRWPRFPIGEEVDATWGAGGSPTIPGSMVASLGKATWMEGCGRIHESKRAEMQNYYSHPTSPATGILMPWNGW